MKWMLFLGLLLVVLNLTASFFVFRNKQLTNTQRFLQITLVWMLPVIGAVLCLAFATSMPPAAARGQATDAGMMVGDIPGNHIAGGGHCSDVASCDAGGGNGGGD